MTSMTSESPLIAVYLVTFRRHDMLRRSLGSALAQTHDNVVVRVVNDDPHDDAVARIIEEFGDDRAKLFKPMVKRGPARNFNLMFEESEAQFVSLLEDDNWWEPRFLEDMLKRIAQFPGEHLIVGNERLWKEIENGGWRDTGKMLWPFSDVRHHQYRIEEICGSAKLCNSSMLIWLDSRRDLRPPANIPVDVTEHFRERLLGPTVLLNGAALVNYAETLQTARTTRGESWGVYQCLLIGSVFAALESSASRYILARRLWTGCSSSTSPRAVSLVAAGLAIPQAYPLVRTAPISALARCAIWLARRPSRYLSLRVPLRDHAPELHFLINAPLTRHLAEELGRV